MAQASQGLAQAIRGLNQASQVLAVAYQALVQASKMLAQASQQLAQAFLGMPLPLWSRFRPLKGRLHLNGRFRPLGDSRVQASW